MIYAALIKNLYDLDQTMAGSYLRGFDYPWEALDGIKELILSIGKTLSEEEYVRRGEDIWISRGAVVYPSACINGPCIIGTGTEIRQCAFIRGSALVGENCVVGNSTELKNVILFNHVQVPHFNYIGDSILGCYSHMGAGSITSNVKSDKSHVHVKGEGQDIDTGRKKFGAMLGDHVEVGCNSVLNPGTVLGRWVSVYPVSSVRGVIPEGSIYKAEGNIALRS